MDGRSLTSSFFGLLGAANVVYTALLDFQWGKIVKIYNQKCGVFFYEARSTTITTNEALIPAFQHVSIL